MPTGYETAADIVKDAQPVEKTKLRAYLAAVERAAVRRHGGVADGTTDNLPALQAARDAAGPSGVVTLDGPGTYAVAGARPDLTGVHLAADPGVTLRVDENPAVMQMRLTTPLRVENPVHGTVQVKPRNVGLDRECHMLGAAAAAALAARGKRTELLDFTAAAPHAWTNYALADPATFTPGTATVAPQKLSWAGGFASGQQGIYFNALPQAGDYYEVTFRQDGPGHGDGFVSIDLAGASKRWAFYLKSGSTTFSALEATVGTTTRTVPNGGAYALVAKTGSVPGSVTMGIRFVDAATVEIYINGHRIHTAAINVAIVRFGFSVSWHISAYTSIENPFRIRGWTPQDAKPLALCCIGDSITWGAWSPLPWPELLPMMAQFLPGIGRLSVTNLAVSGTRSGDWVSGTGGAPAIASLNFSPYDYVLVMLGTNDLQSLTAPATTIANMTTIAGKIVADGARPIIGLFPVYTRADISGTTGVAALNYAHGAIYRSELRRWATAAGYEVADVQETFGTNFRGPAAGWYNDNLHPTTEGNVAVAQAFAAALLRQAAPRPERPGRSGLMGWITPPLLNGWVEYGPTWNKPQYRLRPDGLVELRGAAKGGTVAQGATGRLFALPAGYRPRLVQAFPVACDNGATAVAGFALAHSDGHVYAWTGHNAKFVLDGIAFEPEA